MTATLRARARWLVGIALLLTAASAIALQRGATGTWAVASTALGDRLLLSPIGLVREATPGQPLAECRWWPRLGDESLCALAPDGDAAMTRLRRAYPLAVVAMWTAILALFLNVLDLPRRSPWAGSLVTTLASAFAAAAAWSVTAGARALAVLADAQLQYNQAGFYAVAGAATLSAVAAGLLVQARSMKHADAPQQERSQP